MKQSSVQTTGYELSRNWFNWAFENPEQNTATHTALYMWIIEKWNRLGQKEKFGLPTSEAMEAIGVKSYNTYKKVFNDFVSWQFIILVQESKNQYTANIVALSNFNKAHNKAHNEALDKALANDECALSNFNKAHNEALDKALAKHTPKHLQSNDSINKPQTTNHKLQTVSGADEKSAPHTQTEFLNKIVEEKPTTKAPPVAPPPPTDSVGLGNGELYWKVAQVLKQNPEIKIQAEEARRFVRYWTEQNEQKSKERWHYQKIFDVKKRLATWITNNQTKNGNNSPNSKPKPAGLEPRQGVQFGEW